MRSGRHPKAYHIKFREKSVKLFKFLEGHIRTNMVIQKAVLYSFPQRTSEALSSTDCTSENISLRVLATCYIVIHHVCKLHILRWCSGGLMQWNMDESWTFDFYQEWNAAWLCWAMSIIISCFTSQFLTLYFSNVFWSHVMWVPVTTAWRVLRLRMEERPPMWRVAANKLNNQSRTADEGWPSSLGVGRGANNSTP